MRRRILAVAIVAAGLLAGPALAEPVLARPVLAEPVLARPVLARPVLAGAVTPGSAARADAPPGLSGDITDPVGAITGQHRAQVQAAINHLYADQRVKVDRTGTAGIAGLVALTVVIVLVLLGLVALISFRRRHGLRSPAEPISRAPEPPEPPLRELDASAARALVETDDAIQTSEQELGFATASFGERAAQPFAVALELARGELAAAFRLRQQLDDDIPEDDETRRAMLTEISSRCANASQVLDEQSDAFDRLRDLEARTPETLAELTGHLDEQTARLATTRRAADQLTEAFTPAASASVADAPELAGERLEFARTSLGDAQQALGGGETGRAAVLAQAAESALAQAAGLLDGVQRHTDELTAAATALPGTLAETDADLAEANSLLAGGRTDYRAGDQLAALTARAQSAAQSVRTTARSGVPFDPLAALRTVQDADTALDQALAGVREAGARQDRARALLDQEMLVARSSLAAAEDFISTRRGGVGAAARTRLAEAQRHFQQAGAVADTDAEAALADAQQADGLAQQARSLAEQDVAQFDYGQGAGYGRRGGGFGGGFRRVESDSWVDDC